MGYANDAKETGGGILLRFTTELQVTSTMLLLNNNS